MGVGSKFDKNLLNTSCSTGDDSASVQANEAGANGLAFEAAAEYIPARIIALRKQHAEHLLQVVRKAELRESSRQNKFCHTTSRKNREYLRRRFQVERRADEARISELLQDAQAVEGSLKWYTSNAKREEVSPSSGEPMDQESLVKLPISTNEGRSTKSNAFLEPSDVKEHSRFIPASKMRFMEYAYKKVDHKGEVSARARPGATAIRTRRSREPLSRLPCGNLSPIFAVNTSRHRDTFNTASSESRGSEASNRRGNCKRNLLRDKRNILSELTSLVRRQSKTLEYIAQREHALILPVRFIRRHGVNASTKRQSRATCKSPSSRAPKSWCTKAQPTSCRSRVNIETPVTYDISASPLIKLPTSNTVPLTDNAKMDATSVFLASGGQWAGVGKKTSRKSVASSASYASYGHHEWGKTLTRRMPQADRPRGMPPLRL